MHPIKKTTLEDLQKIPFIPSYYATKEDFSHPHDFLKRLFRDIIQDIGAIRIIPPEEWNPPFYYNQSNLKLHTKVVNFKNLLEGSENTEFKENGPYFYELEKMSSKLDCRLKYRNLVPKLNHQNKIRESELGFWHLVENPIIDGVEIQEAHLLRVEYASDQPRSKFDQWKPKKNSNPFQSMELGNINLEKGELFAFLDTQTHISGLSDSWVYVGMKYAPFCWHAEDLYLPALNYHYLGDVKTWYFIPPKDAEKYEKYFKIRFKEQLEQHPNLLYDLVTIIPPAELIQQGIKIYRVDQQPGDFVFLAGKTYHAGFSHGFNCGEAVNIAQTDWFPIYNFAEADYFSNSPNKRGVFPLNWLIFENVQFIEVKGRDFFKKEELSDIYKLFAKYVKEYFGKIVTKELLSFMKYGKLIPGSMRYDETACYKCGKYNYLLFWYCWTCHQLACKDHPLKCDCRTKTIIFRFDEEFERWFKMFYDILGQHVVKDIHEVRELIAKLNT